MESEEQIAERRRKMVSVAKLRGLQLFFSFPPLPSRSSLPSLAMPCNAGSWQEGAKIKLLPVAPGVTRLFLCLLWALWLG